MLNTFAVYTFFTSRNFDAIAIFCKQIFITCGTNRFFGNRQKCRFLTVWKERCVKMCAKKRENVMFSIAAIFLASIQFNAMETVFGEILFLRPSWATNQRGCEIEIRRQRQTKAQV